MRIHSARSFSAMISVSAASTFSLPRDRVLVFGDVVEQVGATHGVGEAHEELALQRHDQEHLVVAGAVRLHRRSLRRGTGRCGRRRRNRAGRVGACDRHRVFDRAVRERADVGLREVERGPALRCGGSTTARRAPRSTRTPARGASRGSHDSAARVAARRRRPRRWRGPTPRRTRCRGSGGLDTGPSCP